MATATTAGPLLPTIQSSLPQTALNDSTNLQKELSPAAAVALPTPSGNLPSVHTLGKFRGSTRSRQRRTPRSGLFNAAQKNPSNGPSSNGPTTAAPSAIQVSPSSKGTSASATTTTDSSTDHLPPAIQPRKPTTSLPRLPPPNLADIRYHRYHADHQRRSSCLIAYLQPPAPAAPTGDASNAAAELPACHLAHPRSGANGANGYPRVAIGDAHRSDYFRVRQRGSANGGACRRRRPLGGQRKRRPAFAFIQRTPDDCANSLQQQSLRLTQVSFHQGSGLSGNSSSGGGSQQQRFTTFLRHRAPAGARMKAQRFQQNQMRATR